MTTAPTGRLTAPTALAAIVGLGDLAAAAIGWSAYHTRQGAAVPGESSWAAIYVFGLEAAAGAVILLLAIIAAGRAPAAATIAAGLAWLRLAALAVTAVLMAAHVGFAGPFDGSDVVFIALAFVDALAGALISGSIARRTHRRLLTRP
jgi:hypothetical protein